MPDSWWAGMAADRAQLLPRLRGLLAEHTGLIFPPERWHSLERAVETVGREQGFADAQSWLQWFTSAPPTLQHMQSLVGHLTVGETYFFRDQPLFAALRDSIFPTLIDSRRNSRRFLRIWSAGCSTGEEPYSIAITLQRLLPDWRQWQIVLAATDINDNSIAKAQAGIYDSWSFRSGLPRADDVNFVQRGPRLFEVAPALKEMVRFSHLNLANAVYPAGELQAMDIIFCRNVLMYLEPGCAQAIIDRFYRTLAEGGWLIVSAVESGLVERAEFSAQRSQDLILFRKDSAAAERRNSAQTIAPKTQRAQKKTSGSGAAATSTTKAAPRIDAASTAQARSTAAPLPIAKPPQVAAAKASTHSAAAPPSPVDADVAALIARARACANSGELAPALDYCNRAIAIDKLNPVCTDLLAFILLEQDAGAAAEAALKRTLYLDQNRVLTHVNLGNLLMQQPPRRGEAQRHFRTALELLRDIPERQILPETDGITVGQLREIIQTTMTVEMPA